MAIVSGKFQQKKLWPLMKRHFLSIYAPQVPSRAVDIYLDAFRLGIHPPLFTSPSGDSCIIFNISYLIFCFIYLNCAPPRLAMVFAVSSYTIFTFIIVYMNKLYCETLK